MNTHQSRKMIRLERWFEASSNSVHSQNSIAVEHTVDIMNDGQPVKEHGHLATRTLERDFAEIRRIEAALTRIDDGAYGFISDAIMRVIGIICASFRMLTFALITTRRGAMFGVHPASMKGVIGASVAR